MAAALAAAASSYSSCGSGGGSSDLLEVRAEAGSRLDLGHSGRAQQVALPPGLVLLGRMRDCTTGPEGRQCEIRGTKTHGEPFGLPIPVLDPDLPVCLVAQSSGQLRGTFYPDSGCSGFELPLHWDAFLKPLDEDFPCPVCTGDPRPGDNAREGVCSGGDNAGDPCDAAPAFSASGRTSLDCPPATERVVGSWEGNLVLTTGGLERLAGDVCQDDRVAGVGDCLCDLSRFPSSCTPTEFVYRCSKEPNQECSPGSGSAECEFRHPGYGTCEPHPLPCFSRLSFTIVGACRPSDPTMVGFFCAPLTEQPILNILIGTPGPGLVKLDARLLLR